jgi:hypothetical protein
VRAAAAEGVDPDKLAKVKSAYVLNFVRFTEWPAADFDSDASPIVIGVVNAGGVGRYLPKLVEGVTVSGRRLTVEPIDPPAGGDRDRFDAFVRRLRRCHAVYLGSADRDLCRAAVRGLRDSDVLTVSDAERFAAGGGMLGLVLDGGRVVFEANPAAIQRTRLGVSSKVLKLARIVKEDD